MRRPLSWENVAPDGRLLAFLAFAAALLSIAFVVLAAGGAPLEPGDLLPYFQAHRTRYVLGATASLAWILASIPLVASVKALLGGEGRALLLAATLLSACGVALLGFGSFVAIGSFFALDSAGAGIAARLQAPYQAAIWRSMGFLLSDPGLMALGGGQVLFARIAWRTEVPRWLVVTGFVGGIAGLLTLAVYQTPLLALVQLLSFSIVAAATGVALLANRARGA